MKPDPRGQPLVVGESYDEQAQIVYRYEQAIFDVRDRLALPEQDGRGVMLNNMAQAAGGCICALRVMHFVREQPPQVGCAILGVGQPEFLEMAADDLLRMGRLFLLTETQFQVENGLRNILEAIYPLNARQGFYNIASDILTATGLDGPGVKLRLLNVPALLRNSKHANGVHYGWKGADFVTKVGDVEFEFRHGQRVQCGKLEYVIHALTAALAVIDEILSSDPVRTLAHVPDAYAEQAAQG